MKLKLVKPDDTNISNVPVSPDEATVRAMALQSAKNFKACWKDLAKSLAIVWKEKFYKDWGYQTFDAYTAKEIRIRKHTALKLINSYQFLEKEEPQYLNDSDSNTSYSSDTPTFEAVNTLRLAKRKLDDQDYEAVKKDMFEKNRDIQEVKKDLTALIRQRKDTDPEEERKKHNELILKRTLGTLKSLKQEVEMLKLLPGPIIKDISAVITAIEKQLQSHT
jgi:hypothetical protein